MKTGSILQIKPTRKLHDSGFRILKVFVDEEYDKPLSKTCDVVDLSVNGTSVRIDIDRSGYIRIWSSSNKIRTEEGQFSTVFARLEKRNDNTYKRADRRIF